MHTFLVEWEEVVECIRIVLNSSRPVLECSNSWSLVYHEVSCRTTNVSKTRDFEISAVPSTEAFASCIRSPFVV